MKSALATPPLTHQLPEHAPKLETSETVSPSVQEQSKSTGMTQHIPKSTPCSDMEWPLEHHLPMTSSTGLFQTRVLGCPISIFALWDGPGNAEYARDGTPFSTRGGRGGFGKRHKAQGGRESITKGKWKVSMSVVWIRQLIHFIWMYPENRNQKKLFLSQDKCFPPSHVAMLALFNQQPPPHFPSLSTFPFPSPSPSLLVFLSPS